MKKLIMNYTFSPLSKQVTLTDFVTLDLERLLLITNVTSGLVIYNFASPSLGGTVVNNAVVLEYDTTAMNSTDDLQIFYDVDVDHGAGNATSTGTQRVVIATDQTTIKVNDGGGSLSIDDNGGSLTVDGTVGATQSGTWTVGLNTAIPTGTNSIGSVGISSIAVGSNVIGKVGIDQTTPGTSNGVAITQVDGSTVAVGNGASNNGTLRVAIANDNAPVDVKVTILDNSSSSSYEAYRVVSNLPAVLKMITGYNSSMIDQFIQLHDATTLPSDGSIPVMIFKVPSESNFSLDLGFYGRAFSNGIVICNSTTGPTKTLGASDCWFDIQYS
jgi:hypothetical protein